MLDNNHELFHPPKNNCTIWRYMNFSKMLSLLENKNLFFTRVDKFEDRHEGTWSKAGMALLKEQIKRGELPENAFEELKKLPNVFRKQMFANCWIASEHESAAMWDLYNIGDEGIAIKSDHDSLSRAIESSKLCGRTTLMQYIDYDTTPIPWGNIFFPFLHKRLSFSHENELRALFFSGESENEKIITTDQTFLTIDIDPSDLIKSIHVSPRAPDWFGDLVEHILKRYTLPVPVERSSLYERPIY